MKILRKIFDSFLFYASGLQKFDNKETIVARGDLTRFSKYIDNQYHNDGKCKMSNTFSSLGWVINVTSNPSSLLSMDETKSYAWGADDLQERFEDGWCQPSNEQKRGKRAYLKRNLFEWGWYSRHPNHRKMMSEGN